MERSRTWQVAVTLLFSAVLLAQQQPTGIIPGAELGQMLDAFAAVPGNPLKFDRVRILQGYTQDVYALVQQLRSISVYTDVRPEGKPEDRAKVHEWADRLDQHLRALLARNETRLRNPDRDNLARYGESDLILAPPAPGEQRVVFMGDSITDGWRLQEYFVG